MSSNQSIILAFMGFYSSVFLDSTELGGMSLSVLNSTPPLLRTDRNALTTCREGVQLRDQLRRETSGVCPCLSSPPTISSVL